MPDFKCMNARLGRLENTWRAHRVEFYENFSQRERIPFLNTLYMASSSASDPPVILSKDDIPGP